MELKDIVFILSIFVVLSVIINFYLLYKTRNIKITENFDVTADIKKAINDQYKIDIDAMRSLANLANTIKTGGDSLTLPASNVKVNTLVPMSGSPRVTVAARELAINGNIQMDGSAGICIRDRCYGPNQLDFLPKRSIISFYRGKNSSNLIPIPWGWAICDGKYYKYDEAQNKVIEALSTDANAIDTPDLRGRFILGSGVATGNNLTNSYTDFGTTSYERDYNFIDGETGGENKHLLTIPEIPSHSHNTTDRGCLTDCRSGLNSFLAGVSVGGNPVGGSQTHNNMPPYFALCYIMRIAM